MLPPLHLIKSCLFCPRQLQACFTRVYAQSYIWVGTGTGWRGGECDAALKFQAAALYMGFKRS